MHLIVISVWNMQKNVDWWHFWKKEHTGKCTARYHHGIHRSMPKCKLQTLALALRLLCMHVLLCINFIQNRFTCLLNHQYFLIVPRATFSICLRRYDATLHKLHYQQMWQILHVIATCTRYMVHSLAQNCMHGENVRKIPVCFFKYFFSLPPKVHVYTIYTQHWLRLTPPNCKYVYFRRPHSWQRRLCLHSFSAAGPKCRPSEARKGARRFLEAPLPPRPTQHRQQHKDRQQGLLRQNRWPPRKPQRATPVESYLLPPQPPHNQLPPLWQLSRSWRIQQPLL